MKIIAIFEPKLFTIHYENEQNNEFERLMNLWTDVSFLNEFAKTNKIVNPRDIRNFIKEILEDTERFDDFMASIENNQNSIAVFFRPLDDLETGAKILSLQKGKLKRSFLRLYAIKIDEETFLITGGAIKIVHKMKESEMLLNEVRKLNIVRDYLNKNGIFDNDSFYEFKLEQDENK
jgi:hypothetical protein